MEKPSFSKGERAGSLWNLSSPRTKRKAEPCSICSWNPVEVRWRKRDMCYRCFTSAADEEITHASMIMGWLAPSRKKAMEYCRRHHYPISEWARWWHRGLPPVKGKRRWGTRYLQEDEKGEWGNP